MLASAELANVLRDATLSRPGKTAFTEDGLSVAYGQLHRDVESLAARLIEHGIGPGAIVGVHIRRVAAHWSLLLALMRVGAVSVSLTSRYPAEIEALPGLSAVLCAPGQAPVHPRSIRIIEVTRDWLAASTRSVSLPDPRAIADRIGRICFTSGTSGAPKAILLDAEILRHRLSGSAGRSRITAETVIWCALGVDTAYAFTATLATWLVGGTVLFATKREDVLRSEVNLIIASPAALQALRPVECPAVSGVADRIDGMVIVAGGRLTITLRDAVLRELCSEVLLAYGSSEAGGVTLGDAKDLDRQPGAVGRVFPDVEVQIVDRADTPLPNDARGLVRVKTKNAATHYLGDQTASDQHFKDGWFYPGDIATLSRDGVLTVFGRPSQVLNIGGAKFSAEDIDTAVCSQAGVQDACTVLLPYKDGSVRVGIAIVCPSEIIKSVASSIRRAMPDLPPFSIVPISAVPRNSMGKVNREEFGRMLIKQLRNPGSAHGSDGFVVLQCAERSSSESNSVEPQPEPQ